MHQLPHLVLAQACGRRLFYGPLPLVARVCQVRQAARPFRPCLAGDHGDDLLRDDVERVFRDLDAIELAGVDGTHRRRTLDEVVARQRKENSLGDGAEPVTGAADALQQRRDGARRAEVADELDGTDIDAELERCRRHDDWDGAALQAFLGL